jgi:hypothetical protein
MKRNALPFVFLGVLSMSTAAYAQEFSKQAIPEEAYANNPKTYALRNQQKVQEAYQSLTSVYTLDFSGAVPKTVSPGMTSVTEKVVSNAGFVQYNNREAIAKLFAEKPEVLTVELPFKGEVLVADLVKADLFGDDFKVSSNDPSKVANIQLGLYYQGTLRGTNAIVTFSFFENEFSALITREVATNSVIEAGFVRTDDNSSGTHVVYTDDDLKVSFAHPCTAENLDQYQDALDKISKMPPVPENEKVLLKCVTYFWETSYNMYQQFGSTAAVTNYMTNLFNNFQIIYNNESIGSRLNQLYIWTSADSYNNDLNTFSANRSGFGANLATLFSTTGGGGVAWVDVLCGSNEYYKHGFCGSVGGSFPAFPNYSWPVNVSTHEVGHNLGSPHTHACTWSGGAIDGCGPTAGYSEGCTAALPAGGGTIMSYCHLISTGINFNNGFGPQPGNLIRGRVNGCITLTCETNPGGGSCASSYEPNESLAAAVTIPAGPTLSAAISTSTDNDYFKFTTGTTTNNVINLVGPGGVDFDLAVYNSAGTLLGSGTSGSATETVTLNGQAAGTYVIRVYGYNGANSATCYTIKATATSTACATSYEPNETLGAAIALTTGSTINAAISTSTDNDYYKITTTATANNSYVLAGPAGVDFDMAVYNSGGTLLGSGTSGSANETVTLNGQAAGTYIIRIYGYNGATSATCYNFSTASSAPNVMASSPMSMEDEEAELTLYPNPTSDKLSLGGDYTGRLINQLGQVVMEFTGSELSLKELQSGVYLLQVEGSTKLYRVMKQ